jgi:hypothetical protein
MLLLNTDFQTAERRVDESDSASSSSWQSLLRLVSVDSFDRRWLRKSLVFLAGESLLIYICNFHVLSHLLLNYMCKLHWNYI